MISLSVSRAAAWLLLIALSVLFVVLLVTLHLPAALLLGPMIAAIVVAVSGGTPEIPRAPYALAQAVIGCMVARSIPTSAFAQMAAHWPLFIVAVLSVVAVSTALGWVLARFRVLPGTTAVWGSFPGAATAMMLMAEAYGADARLVAFMQYLRVVMVAIAASLVSVAFGIPSHGHVSAVQWFAPVAWPGFLLTLTLIIGCALIARVWRIHGGPLLLPMMVALILQDILHISLELPPLLLAASYLLVGWSIGLRFTPGILRHAMRAFPRVLLAIVTLIAICGGFSVLLSHVAGVDALTAYLAMSPGGADSVAIIAASSTVSLPFVMALQVARFMFVLLAGPSLARYIAKKAQ